MFNLRIFYIIINNKMSFILRNTNKQEEKYELINKYTLNYNNKKLDDEYNKSNEKNNKNYNIGFASICLVMSISILIWITMIKKEIESDLNENKVIYQQIDKETTNMLKELDSEQFICINHYAMLNKTQYIEAKLNLDTPLIEIIKNYGNYSSLFIPNTNSYFMSLIVSSVFMNAFQLLEILLSFTELFILIFSAISKRISWNKFYFSLLLFLFSLNFHLISIIVRYYSSQFSDPIFFVIAIDLLFQVIITFYSRVGFLHIAITNIIGSSSEWFLFTYILGKYLFGQTIIYYLSVNTLIHILLIVLYYKNDLSIKNEFYLKKKLNFEKNYLMDFVENMSQGFLSYTGKNKKVLFCNKAIKNIFEEFNEITGRIYNYKDTSNNFVNDPISLRITETEQFCFHMPCKENLISKSPTSRSSSFRSNNNKIILEKMFNYLTQINSELPEEISNSIKENLSHSLVQGKGFNLDDFFSLIKNKKDLYKFDDFTSLGILNIKKDALSATTTPTFDYSHIHFDTDKTYQILFRIITHEYADEYLEIMFSDISKVLLDERERTLLNARSMYLSKIAHEFKNPLTSLVELSLNVKDEFQTLANIENLHISDDLKETSITKSKQKILNSVDYSEKIYKIMIHFLKDFSVFSNLKLPCDKNKNKCENNLECRQCGVSQMCSKCSTCKNCEENKTSLFDYKFIMDEVIENFDSLGKYENKNLHINFVNEHDNLTNMMSKIKTNKELFSSVIFNLIYHSYKSSHTKTKIEINSYPVQMGQKEKVTYFEISNEGFEIDPNFIKMLNSSEKLNFEDDNFCYSGNLTNKEVNHEIKSDSFNKYFDLYISFFILKKMNSSLRIESGKNCCKYYFLICSHDEDDQSSYNNNCTSNNSLEFHNVRNEKNEKMEIISPIIITKNEACSQNNDCTKEIDKSLIIEYDKLKLENLDFQMDDPNIPYILNGKETKSSLNVKYFSANISEISKKIYRCLVIDDENLIRNTIKRHLKKIERNNAFVFEIFEACNCFDAITILHEKLIENKQFDLIIIDEYMPFMKGSTLIKLLKQLHSENNFYKTTLISHTAFDSLEKKKFISDSGADFILSKPVEYREFEDFIIKLL